ncbi:unnamed protein product [Rhodiola kirilowii]
MDSLHSVSSSSPNLSKSFNDGGFAGRRDLIIASTLRFTDALISQWILFDSLLLLIELWICYLFPGE